MNKILNLHALIIVLLIGLADSIKDYTANLRHFFRKKKPAPLTKVSAKCIKSILLGVTKLKPSAGRITALSLFFIIVSFTAFGQLDDLGNIDNSTVESWFGSIEMIYGIVVLVGGYLSSFIPFLNKIESGTYRVFTFALVVGLGFVWFGSDIISLAVTYAASTSLYEVIFKLFKKSPDPKPST